ncbi:MAG TPA: MFS transporter [Patescibacteria group bacterium]|nr:MFS transporter [Patescibacteria group bacterium]
MNQSHKIILFLLSLSMFVVVLDSAIINLALPAIQKALRFDDSTLQWVVTSYILTFGGFLMLGGRTADLYGRRRVLMLGLAGFTFCSFLIGFSTSSTMLIILRALQGLSGAFMAPTALSILLTSFKEGPERNKALSIWSIVASGGAAAGVFLGGVLTQYLGWQWCFFVNVPIGVAAMWGIRKYLPAHILEARDKHLDLPGAILITGGLIALVYALTVASTAGWTDTTTVMSFVISVMLLAAFLFNETKAKHPLMPLSIFRLRNLVAGNLIMLPVIAGALGQFFFLSLYIQNILHYAPSVSGVAFLPIPIIIGFVSYNTPRLLSKFSAKQLTVVGVGLATLGVFIISFLGENSSYWLHMFPAFLLLAVGFGMSFVAITIAATNGVPHDEAGLASGILGTAQQIGGALGLAVLAVVAHTTTTSDLAAGQNLLSATMHGYQQAFLTAAALMFIAWLVAIFILKQQKTARKVL